MTIGAATAGAAVHLGLAEDAIYARGVRFSTLDWIAAATVILGAIELTRRAAGLIIPILIVLALSYVVSWGAWIGGVFSFPGLSWETMFFRSIYGDDALFGGDTLGESRGEIPAGCLLWDFDACERQNRGVEANFRMDDHGI